MTQGYILLINKSDNGYYGINRDLFEPLLVETEFEKNIPNKQYTLISSFYPEGWRKKAYELYEANQIAVTESDFYILEDYETAVKIQELIKPYIGDYEIFRTKVSDDINAFVQNGPSFGYDFAYPGGDHYSAIKNGLFVNRSETLYKKYRSLLN